jgi:hypothetical protein
LKKKTTWRDWVAILTFGLAGALAYHAVIILVALLAGYFIGAFLNIEWYFTALISYFGIRMIIEGVDAFSGLTAKRCPICRRKIKTSRSIKCEECGGAAQLFREKPEK